MNTSRREFLKGLGAATLAPVLPALPAPLTAQEAFMLEPYQWFSIGSGQNRVMIKLLLNSQYGKFPDELRRVDLRLKDLYAVRTNS